MKTNVRKNRPKQLSEQELNSVIIMSDAAERISEYLNEEGYNPYSPTRSRQVAKFVVKDLLEHNPRMREDAEDGRLVYQTEYQIAPSVKPKIVLGVVNDPDPPSDDRITKDTPDHIWCAISYASIMTRHNQNLNNRVSDARLVSFEAFELNPQIVTASLVLTNIAEDVDFEHVSDIRTHSNVEEEVQRIRNRFGKLEGSPRENSSRPDAVGCIVIDYDGDSSSLREEFPAPEEGDQLFYPDFVIKISNEIDKRFYDLPQPVNANPKELISVGEGRTIDFKRELDHADSLAAEVAAFMNTDGGAILLGVDDDGTIIGLDDIDHTHHRVSNILFNNLDGEIAYQTERTVIEGEDILLIRLPQARETLYEVNGKFFIRVGESKKPMRFEILRSFFTEWFRENPERLF